MARTPTDAGKRVLKPAPGRWAAPWLRWGASSGPFPDVVGPGAASWLLSALSILAGLVLWEALARRLPQAILAPPSVVAAHFVGDLRGDALAVAFGRSMGALLLGYLLALGVAIPVGFLIGRNETAREALDPLINAVYVIPPVAFVPFLVIWFGLFFPARVALVFLMCVFEMLLTVGAGARDVDRGLLEVGRSFGAGRVALVTKVIVPAALPFLITAVRIGLVRAISAVITAELFFAAVNLGAMMKESAKNFDTAGLLVVIVLLSGFGLAAQEGLKALEARALPWHIRQ